MTPVNGPVPNNVMRFLIHKIIKLYPGRFRQTYGASMAEDFETLYQMTSGASRFSRTLFFIKTSFDMITAAFSEHMRGAIRNPARTHGPQLVARRERDIMHGTWQDIRFAVRGLRRQPFFAIVVVMTLAIGIGTNTAIFSLVSRVLWSELPYAEPDQLVSVWSSNIARGVNRWGVSLHDYTDWRTRSEVFSDVAAYNVNTINLSGTDRPQRVTYAQVTPSFFTTLETPPQLGRIFNEQENLPGRDNVVILSNGFWRDMLGGTDSAIGSMLTVDGRRMTVIGIMPPTFAFPTPTVQLWKPFGMLPEDEGGRDGRWVRAIGRLAANTPMERAQASLDVLGESLALEYPESNDGFGIYVEPLLTTTVSGVRASLLILWGTTGLILLIVCANIANMVLARAMTRSRETAVRAALGATRARLIRQLVAEGLPLAFLGCIAGIGLAALSIRLLPLLVGSQIPRLHEVTLDGRIVAYSLAVSLLVGFVFSVIPALRSSGTKLSSPLRNGTRGSDSDRIVKIRNGIVVTQIALAVTVVVGAGLLTKSLVALLATNPGFSGDRILTMRMAPSVSEMPERQQASQLFARIQAGVQSIPGVTRVSAINSLPLTGNSWGTTVEFPGANQVDPSNRPQAFNRVTLPGYHETMGIPLLQGRLLLHEDREGTQNAIVINETAAKSWWPNDDAIGKIVQYDGVPRTVAGVVGDVAMSGPGAPPASMMYVPFSQARFGHFQNWGMTFVIQMQDDPGPMTETIVEYVASVAPNIPIYSVRTMSDVMAATVTLQTLYTRLLGIFAAIALTLSTIGVYGVISYVVNQARREIGVRIALGAATIPVMQLVVRRALRLGVFGIVVGTFVATMATRTLDRFLYETSPVDLLTYALTAAIFTLAVLAASLEPAIRATRADPVNVLRSE